MQDLANTMPGNWTVIDFRSQARRRQRIQRVAGAVFAAFVGLALAASAVAHLIAA
jgi:hypothetical protein